jgi:hypothetical protein
MDIRQCGKCGPHRSCQFFDFTSRSIPDKDFKNAIMFLESGKDIVIDFVRLAIHSHGDGQCRPDVEHLARRRCTFADNSQVQATWRCKYDGSPPRAYVYESLPFVVVANTAHVEGEYFKEDLFGKHLDCKLAYYVTMISDPCEVVQKRYSTPIFSG